MGLVVLVPGLGLPAYTRPTAVALAAAGLRCAVLDLPGFGSHAPRAASPEIRAMGRVAAQWVAQQDWRGPLAVMGHSTGAQAALTAALVLQETRTAAVVLAGPTFRPAHRALPRLLAVTPLAYRRDSPGELSAFPQLLRGGRDVVSILRSGMADRIEDRLPALRLPVVLTAGRQDAYAPRSWLDQLARRATASPSVTIAVTPGSHNNLFTQPEAITRVVVRSLERAPSSM